MALTFVISGPLRELAGNRGQIRIARTSDDVSGALSLLWAEHPAFRDRMVTERGELRPHLNIFVDGESITFSGGFATRVRDGAEIVILPALSGG
jgi:molybdopterin synthase sulfur carrier subunit